MNNDSEKLIEERLRQLASLRPDDAAVEKMNRRLKAQLVGPTPASPLLYSLVSAAAMLFMCVSLWTWRQPVRIAGPAYRIPNTASMARIELNRAFQIGGQKALDEHLNQVYAQRDAQPKPLTLQDVMKEL